MTTAGEILLADTNAFLSATDRSRRLEEIEAIGLAIYEVAFGRFSPYLRIRYRSFSGPMPNKRAAPLGP